MSGSSNGPAEGFCLQSVATGEDIIVEPVVPSANSAQPCDLSRMALMVWGLTTLWCTLTDISRKQIIRESIALGPVRQRRSVDRNILLSTT